MKLNTLKTLTLVVTLLVSVGAMAADTFIIKLNGGDKGNYTPGEVTLSKTSTEGTITVTPSGGYYLIVENLKVTKKIDGSNAQTRMGINTPITVTPTDANADLSGVTTYTFDITDTDFEYEVTADFGVRLPLSGSGYNTLVTISGDNYDYTGEEIKPTTTSVKWTNTNGASPVEETLVADKDFTLSYQNNIYPTYYRRNVIPTVIVKGKSKYIDEAQPTYFNIKPTIAFEKASYETTYGAEFTAPTATIAPNTANITDQNYDGMTFTATYEATDADGNATDVITVNASTGAVTINKAGTAKVKAKTLINEGSPFPAEYITASYTLTINKATITLAYSSEKAEAKMGETFTAPTLNNPSKVAVTYSSSKTDVATISEEGAVTVKGPGETTISAAYAGDSNHEAATASYTITVKKATITLTYSSDKADAKMGETFTAPTLNNPSKVAVTYSSSKTDVATISEEGAVTLKGPGETTISAAYAGDSNHEAATASYVLTVAKMQDAGLSWTDAGMKYYLGDWWYGPRLNNPNNLKVKYKSSDEEVATIDEKGVVTALAVGDTWIMAIFEGNEQFEAQTVRYGLFVRERYDLLVNDTRVTSDNNRNVLGDGHFFYDENTKQLVVTSNESPVTIESRMKNLTIFLNGSSKLDRIFFNNEGNEQNTGSLTITTYENIPGSVVLETSHADGVISGFSSLTIDDKSYTYLLDPAEGKYEGGKLVTSLGAVATTATIGQYLKPLVDGQTVTFPPGKFAIDDFTNMVIDDILYTMVLRADGSDEDDDFYDPVESAIVLNNLNSTSGVTMLIDNVEKSMLIPGSAEYALQFKGGITFMVPNGEGTITLNVKTEPGYKLMLMIGKSEPKEISQNEGGDVQFTYNVEKATYVCVYLVQSAGTRGTRIGKRDKHHGSIYSIKVEPTKVVAMNPLGQVEGYPGSQKPEVVVHHSTGIKEIKIEPANETSGDDSWYDMQGRKIEKPTKAGIYIQNRKKIVIK